MTESKNDGKGTVMGDTDTSRQHAFEQREKRYALERDKAVGGTAQ